MRRVKAQASSVATFNSRRAREKNSDYVVADTRMGPMIVRKDDSIIGRSLRQEGDFQTDEILRACELLGFGERIQNGGLDCFVDVGANIGTHSLRAIQDFGFSRAIAVEPNAENFRLLAANVTLNAVQDRVLLVNKGASTEPGTATLRLSPTNRGDHRLQVSNTPLANSEQRWESEVVELDRVDRIAADIEPATSLVWIDVQGHEREALLGMTGLLQRKVPVAFELWPEVWTRLGHSTDEIHDLLSDYQLVDLAAHEAGPLSKAALADLFQSYAHSEVSSHTMILAIPR